MGQKSGKYLSGFLDNNITPPGIIFFALPHNICPCCVFAFNFCAFVDFVFINFLCKLFLKIDLVEKYIFGEKNLNIFLTFFKSLGLSIESFVSKLFTWINLPIFNFLFFFI